MGIHDETIRKILEEKEEEIALLELAFPEECKTLWKVDTVEYEKDTYIPEEEAENRMDMVLSVEGNNGKKRKIYFLFEHKSYKSDQVLLDLLRYVSLAYKKHLNHENQELGSILPILLIQTEEPWDPPGLSKLLNLDDEERESFEKFLPFLDVRIINLHRGVMDRLDLRKFFHFMLYVMHYIRAENFLIQLATALKGVGKHHFPEDEKGFDRFQIFSKYIFRSIRRTRREEMTQVISETISEKRSLEYMTMAEREQYEGERKALFQTARRMVEAREPVDKISLFTGLSVEELQSEGILSK